MLVVRAESSPSADAVGLIKGDAGEFVSELTRLPEAHESPRGVLHQHLDIGQHDAIPEIGNVLGDVSISFSIHTTVTANLEDLMAGILGSDIDRRDAVIGQGFDVDCAENV